MSVSKYEQQMKIIKFALLVMMLFFASNFLHGQEYRVYDGNIPVDVYVDLQRNATENDLVNRLISILTETNNLITPNNQYYLTSNQERIIDNAIKRYSVRVNDMYTIILTYNRLQIIAVTRINPDLSYYLVAFAMQ